MHGEYIIRTEARNEEIRVSIVHSHFPRAGYPLSFFQAKRTSSLERREKGETFTSATASRAHSWHDDHEGFTLAHEGEDESLGASGKQLFKRNSMRNEIPPLPLAQRIGLVRRTETSLLAIRRWKLESRAHTDRPQEQPPLEWHERRVHRVHPSALSLSFSLSLSFFIYVPSCFISSPLRSISL